MKKPTITKSMKAGYQNKPDSMRDLAHKTMKNMDGGKSCNKSVQKFAIGGVAKIRHEEATAQGMPRSMKKKSLSESM